MMPCDWLVDRIWVNSFSLTFSSGLFASSMRLVRVCRAWRVCEVVTILHGASEVLVEAMCLHKLSNTSDLQERSTESSNKTTPPFGNTP